MPDLPCPEAAPSAADPAGRRTVLVLQGGGALGSYQAGVFEALTEAGVAPDWVAGVSIGAINAAIIAGNAPGHRHQRLHDFWTRITANTAAWPQVAVPGWDGVEQRVGAAQAMMFGQPGFFKPRGVFDWFAETKPVSYYDTADLRATLEALVDFDRINALQTPAGSRDGIARLSVGTVEVETGNMIYFDSARMKLGPEHIMASGALPPGFAAVEIDGVAYWDGGLVSNTPLQYVMSEKPRVSSLVFQVDLFPAHGPLPRTLDEVTERDKDIRYSSRTRSGTTEAGEQQNMRRHVREFLHVLPPELRDHPVARELAGFACAALIDVVHLIYRPEVPQGAQKDFQFDRGTMERRWAEGLADARITLRAAPWRVPADTATGFRTFDVTGPDARAAHPRPRE